MIRFPTISETDLTELRRVLSPALADYRLWRGHVEPGEEWMEPIPQLTHLLQRWLIPRGLDLASLI